jgi:hypothetical protein
MALQVSSYGSAGGLRHKIVYESASGATANVDALGTPGTILSLDIDNLHSATVYFKMKTTSGTYTAGTSEPDFMWRLGAATAKRFDFPDGIPFNQLTFWCNDGPNTSDTDAPGGTVKITFVCS